MSDEGATRRYSEEEIGRLLKRATEIQLAEPTGSGPTGMSLSELEAIALEAGIDPRHLRRAAVELESGSAGESLAEKLAGESLLLTLEAVVPGEIDATGCEQLVPVIQHIVTEHGQASLLGRTLTWRVETPSKTRSTMVVVSARNGETRIRIEERLQGLASQLFGGMVGGGGGGLGIGVGIGVGVGALGSAAFAIAFPLGVTAIGYIAAREIYRVQVKGRRRALSALLERLRVEAAELVAPPEELRVHAPDALPRG